MRSVTNLLSGALDHWLSSHGTGPGVMLGTPPTRPPPASLFDDEGPCFLHVGCGLTGREHVSAGLRLAPWREIRLDIDPGMKPDIVASITDMEAVPEASVDAVYSSHNLEHLHAHEVPLALREFRRVLRPEGFLVLTCPDLLSVCRRIVDGQADRPAYHSPAGPVTPLDMLFGYRGLLAQGYLDMAHRTGFTMDMLADLVSEAGFASVLCKARPEHYDLWLVASGRALSDQALDQLAQAHWPA